MVGDRKIEGAEDLISKLPDAILQHIICFNIPTKLAIKTSILSRRWRHVWCELLSLSLCVGTPTTAASVNETLTRYTAPNTKSFNLTIEYATENKPYIDRLIKFAMSHNVENLSLDFSCVYYEYKLPDFFYRISSVKRLDLRLSSSRSIVPQCTVSWTSLQTLSLACDGLSDESMAKILSGCPILENLSMIVRRQYPYYDYKLPDFFYSNSSFKQLDVTLSCYHTIVLNCTVSWTSLQKLTLRFCRLSDESMAKILSGCPILEKLKLYYCDKLEVLDLSNSLCLRALDLTIGNMTVSGPRQIVAPHIHYLRLYDPQLFCTLVDVSSLTEAELEVSCFLWNSDFNANFLQVVVLKMLDKLKNAEKLRLGSSFIQILSKIGGVPFPMLKVKALNLDTKICQYVIPVIERLIQNSPDLETLTLHGRTRFHMPVEILDIYKALT